MILIPGDLWEMEQLSGLEGKGREGRGRREAESCYPNRKGEGVRTGRGKGWGRQARRASCKNSTRKVLKRE